MQRITHPLSFTYCFCYPFSSKIKSDTFLSVSKPDGLPLLLWFHQVVTVLVKSEGFRMSPSPSVGDFQNLKLQYQCNCYCDCWTPTSAARSAGWREWEGGPMYDYFKQRGVRPLQHILFDISIVYTNVQYLHALIKLNLLSISMDYRYVQVI